MVLDTDTVLDMLVFLMDTDMALAWDIISMESVKLKPSQDILDMDMVVMALVMLVTLAMVDTDWVTDMAAITTESVKLKQNQDTWLTEDMVMAMLVILATEDTVWVTEEDTTTVKWKTTKIKSCIQK